MRDLIFLLGQTLDFKYRLEEQVSQWGMGAVFRATHLGTDRVVALKLIAPGLMDQQKFVTRFHREARATGRLRVITGPGNVIGGSLGFAGRVFVFVGLKFWGRFLPQGSHYGVYSLMAWWALWCTLLLAMLGPLNGIFSALTYLRMRSIARESMVEAYKGFEQRLSR